MEPVYFSETAINFYQTARRDIPEYIYLQFRSYLKMAISVRNM
jgi:hypothetical protein